MIEAYTMMEAALIRNKCKVTFPEEYRFFLFNLWSANHNANNHRDSYNREYPIGNISLYPQSVTKCQISVGYKESDSTGNNQKQTNEWSNHE